MQSNCQDLPQKQVQSWRNRGQWIASSFCQESCSPFWAFSLSQCCSQNTARLVSPEPAAQYCATCLFRWWRQTLQQSLLYWDHPYTRNEVSRQDRLLIVVDLKQITSLLISPALRLSEDKSIHPYIHLSAAIRPNQQSFDLSIQPVGQLTNSFCST